MSAEFQSDRMQFFNGTISQLQAWHIIRKCAWGYVNASTFLGVRDHELWAIITYNSKLDRNIGSGRGRRGEVQHWTDSTAAIEVGRAVSKGSQHHMVHPSWVVPQESVGFGDTHGANLPKVACFGTIVHCGGDIAVVGHPWHFHMLRPCQWHMHLRKKSYWLLHLDAHVDESLTIISTPTILVSRITPE